MIKDKIENSIRANKNGIEGTIGFGFKDLETMEEFYVNGDKRFLTASVFKIPILVELYNQVECGDLSLDETIILKKYDKAPGSGILKELRPGLKLTLKDLSILMMAISDNTATDMLLNKVGKEKVNTTMCKIGLKDTKIIFSCRELLYDLVNLKKETPIEEALKVEEEIGINKNARCLTDYRNNNVTTPKETTYLFEKIFKCEILTKHACGEILKTLKKCQTNWRIPRYLPENVKIAHKTGAMPGVANDTGIIFTENGNYILSIFLNNLDKDRNISIKGFDFIAELSKRVYDIYEASKR